MSAWNEVLARRAARAALMPTVESALRQIIDAHERLKELGFRDCTYAPNDGREYEIVELGSSAIHVARRDDVGRGQCWWIESTGDIWPSHPIMWRRGPTVDGDDHG